MPSALTSTRSQLIDYQSVARFSFVGHPLLSRSAELQDRTGNPFGIGGFCDPEVDVSTRLLHVGGSRVRAADGDESQILQAITRANRCNCLGPCVIVLGRG